MWRTADKEGLDISVSQTLHSRANMKLLHSNKVRLL